MKELIELRALQEIREVLLGLYRGFRPLMDFLIGRLSVAKPSSSTAIAFSQPA
jgi:hypothetical protein